MKLEHKQKTRQNLNNENNDYLKTLKEMSKFLDIPYSKTLEIKNKIMLNYNYSLWNIIFKKGYSKGLFLDEMQKDIPFYKKRNDFINRKIGN